MRGDLAASQHRCPEPKAQGDASRPQALLPPWVPSSVVGKYSRMYFVSITVFGYIINYMHHFFLLILKEIRIEIFVWPQQGPWTLCPPCVSGWRSGPAEPPLRARVLADGPQRTRAVSGPGALRPEEKEDALGNACGNRSGRAAPPPHRKAQGVPASEGFSGRLPGGGGHCSLQVERGSSPAPTAPSRARRQVREGLLRRRRKAPLHSETRIAMQARMRLLLFPLPLFIRL